MPRAVLEPVGPLAERFADAGHRLYLVGGIVRDLLADRPVGRAQRPRPDHRRHGPSRSRRSSRPLAEAVWTQGERFGTIGCTIDGRDYEITTHRAEVYHPDSRKPEVEFATEIDADLSRRDFTVNAMALEVTADAPTLIDPFDGVADLVGKVLRTPIDPDVSFSDDPLRMMRAARFIVVVRPDADRRSCSRRSASMADRLEIVSAERIRDELCKLVVVPDPSAGLWFLHDNGLADVFLPELPAMRLEQDPIHRHKDVLTHTIAVVRKAPPAAAGAARGAVPRRREAQDPLDRARTACRSTTTRWSARA